MPPTPTTPTTETLQANYPTVVALLTKLGIEAAARFTPDKAQLKLTKLLAKKGVPDGLDDKERALAEGLGFAAAPTLKDVSQPIEPAEPEEQAERALPSDQPVPFRLKGAGGQADRVEVITPSIAAKRNGRRAKEAGDDGRRWEFDPEAEVTENIQPAQPKTKAKETPDAQPEKEPPVATATKTKKGGKGATPPKAAKATTKKEPEPKTPPKVAKAKAAAKTNGSPKRGAASRFRELLEGGDRIEKKELIAEVVKAGANPSSAGSYVVWAKRSTETTNPGKGGNPFGFRIAETKEEDGTKFLQRVGKKR